MAEIGAETLPDTHSTISPSSFLALQGTIPWRTFMFLSITRSSCLIVSLLVLRFDTLPLLLLLLVPLLVVLLPVLLSLLVAGSIVPMVLMPQGLLGTHQRVEEDSHACAL